MTCKICGTALNGAQRCPKCGFDVALDYEGHPTLVNVAGKLSIAACRRIWSEK